MTVKDYLAKHAKLATDRGIVAAASSAASEAGAKLGLRPWVKVKQEQARRRLPAQRDLLNELRQRDEWTLLVFDAGRYDYLQPLLADQFSGEIRATFSDARDTFEWISKTWQGDFDDVTYVSGMVPVSDRIPDFDAEDFKRYYDGINPGDSIGDIVTVWKTHWDTSIGTVAPEDVTDVALDYGDCDKLVVHYNQPHSPFIGTPTLLGHAGTEDAEPTAGRPFDEPIWHRVRSGDVGDEYLRMAYWGNAARAIKAAKPVIRERESVVATADHGEALGEYGMYTHDRAPHPKRRVVPWQEVTGLADAAETSSDETNGHDVDDKLEALGYI